MIFINNANPSKMFDGHGNSPQIPNTDLYFRAAHVAIVQHRLSYDHEGPVNTTMTFGLCIALVSKKSTPLLMGNLNDCNNHCALAHRISPTKWAPGATRQSITNYLVSLLARFLLKAS